MGTNNFSKSILIVICICTFIPSYSQTLQLDSVYEVNVTDSAKTFANWLEEHVASLNPKPKQIERINRYFWGLYEDRVRPLPKLDLRTFGNRDYTGIWYPLHSGSLYRSYMGGDRLVGNLNYRDTHLMIFDEGPQYGKRPIVWFINYRYAMTTGFHKRWPETTETLPWDEYHYSWESVGSLDDVLIPEYACKVKKIVISENTEFLKKVFAPKAPIFAAKPLIIFITTK